VLPGVKIYTLFFFEFKPLFITGDMPASWCYFVADVNGILEVKFAVFTNNGYPSMSLTVPEGAGELLSSFLQLFVSISHIHI
jgi:hypothetical protein